MKSFLPALALMSVTTAINVTAIAAEPGAACAPVMTAMAKTLVADHATVTRTAHDTVNGITAGGTNYLQINGVWKASPMSPKDNQARSNENLKNAKSYVCQPLPDSVINGVPVANYRTRTEAEGEVVESNIAISKASGLAVQVDNHLSGENNSQYTTHYSYTNVHAPAIQK